MPPVPVSLLTGWWDACLDQVLDRYRQLRAGRDPGPPGRRPVDARVGVQQGPPGRPGRGAQLAAGLHRRPPEPESQTPARSATRTSRCGCTSTAPANGGTWPTGRRRSWPASPGTWAPGAAWSPSRPAPAGDLLVPLRPGGSHAVGGRAAAHRQGRGRGQPGPGGPPRRPGLHQCAADRGAGRDRPGQRAGPGPRLRLATSTCSPGCATWTRGGVHVTSVTASSGTAPRSDQATGPEPDGVTVPMSATAYQFRGRAPAAAPGVGRGSSPVRPQHRVRRAARHRHPAGRGGRANPARGRRPGRAVASGRCLDVAIQGPGMGHWAVTTPAGALMSSPRAAARSRTDR